MREATKQRLAFNEYVALGADRSLERLAAKLSQDPSSLGTRRAPGFRTLCRWSVALRWQDKLAELEREARRRDAEAQAQALVEMNQRQAKEGLLIQQKAVARLQAIVDQELTPSEAIRFAEAGVRIERLARGDVTDGTSIQRSNDHDFATLSLDELHAIIRHGGGGAKRPPRAGPARPE